MSCYNFCDFQFASVSCYDFCDFKFASVIKETKMGSALKRTDFAPQSLREDPIVKASKKETGRVVLFKEFT